MKNLDCSGLKMIDSDPLTGLFTQQQTGMRKKEFNIATEKLVNAGILEPINQNGKIYYKLTTLGKQLETHFNSDITTQN